MSRTVTINRREYPEFRFAWEVGPAEPSGARPFRSVVPVRSPRTALGYGLLGPIPWTRFYDPSTLRITLADGTVFTGDMFKLPA